MADRTVRINITANAAGYIQGVEAARRKTAELGSEAEKLAAKRQGFEQLGRGVLAVGVAAGVGLGLAVSRFAEFDAAMSSVQASTQESTTNMRLLRAAALQAGGDTKYTATEAAGAIEELAKAGIRTSDILGGALSGSLDLAAAGELAVADAAGIAATAMVQFNKQGSQVPHIADLLAAAAGKAQGSVGDMGAALNQSGLVASQMGLSLEETVGSLTAFASAGLLGSDAGTSFRTMLLRLANPTEESKRKMTELGIAAYDAQGNFVGMESLAGQLQERLGGLSQAQRDQALATIFGADAIRGANVLYEEGAEGIRRWTTEVDQSGYAARVAAQRMDNLQGDVEKLGGAIDTALIQSGSAANDVLRGLVQGATFLVDGIADLPGPVLAVGTALGGLVTAVGLTGGAALIAVPKYAAFKTALHDLEISGKRAAVGVAAAGTAVAAATLLIGAQVSLLAESAGRTDSYAESLDQATGSITDYTRELVVMRLEQSGAYADAEKMGIGFDTVTEAAMGNAGALSELKARSQEWIDQQGLVERYVNGNVFAYDNLRQSVRFTNDELEAGKEQWRTTSEAMAANSLEADVAAEKSRANQEALNGLQGAAAEAGDEISELSDTIRGFGSTALSARDAEREFEAAVDEVTASVEQNGTSLNRGTAAGRANEAALDDVAQAALGLAAATLERTGSEDKARAAVQRGRDELIRMLGQFGITGAAAEAYADELGLIPENVATAVKVTGIDDAEYAIGQLVRTRTATVMVRTVNAGGSVTGPRGAMLQNAEGGFYDYGVQAFAGGGFAAGIYRGRAGGIHKFAEPETGWEAYVSGKPGKEAQNRQIVWEAGGRLGMWSGAYPGSSARGSAAAPLPPIYIQNPFTGEYLLAQVERTAQGAVARFDAAQTQQGDMGYRGEI